MDKVVLIASSQEWTARALESILAPRGYLVLKAYTARQAVERARRDAPDVLIVDAQQAEGDGLDLCRQLRAERVITPSTPILLMLANPPARRDRLAALRAGAWDCLRAPPDPEELLALLDAFVPARLDAEAARTEGLVDEGTGLYNARGVTRRARELASQASRRHAALGCVLLAPAGASGETQDALLRRMAEALKATARVSDAVGRLGPNAVVVVATDTDAAQARALAQRLAAAIPLRLVGGFHGVPDFHAAAIDTTELMLRATAALERARSDPAGVWLRGFEEGAPIN